MLPVGNLREGRSSWNPPAQRLWRVTREAVVMGSQGAGRAGSGGGRPKGHPCSGGDSVTSVDFSSVK